MTAEPISPGLARAGPGQKVDMANGYERKLPEAFVRLALAFVVSSCGSSGEAPDLPSDADVASDDARGDIAPELPHADTADGTEPADADDLASEAGVDATPGADIEVDTGGGAELDAGSPRLLDDRPAWAAPPACGAEDGVRGTLLAGSTEEGFDAELATKARRIERQFHAFNAFGIGVNADLSVSPDRAEDRARIRAFIEETDGWDFEAETGVPVVDVIDAFHKAAGAYAGVGAAADAFRYATLLHEGAPCDEIEQARAHVRAALDALHLATAITGVEGVIARGFAWRGLPGGSGAETTPLFADDGSPLPEEKTNGTWREDNSGDYPDWIWEDSCSRDMLIGWVVGYAAAWEVIRDDPTFTDRERERLQADAEAIARSLMRVGDSGYDLEIRDADGRTTFHGILHEESLDRLYLPGARNGFNALMALGIMGALAYVAEQDDIEAWVYDELVDRRGFLDLINLEMNLLDVGTFSNFSMYNMAFQGGWLALRYLRDPVARARAAESVTNAIYARPGAVRQPSEQGQTFYDLTHVAAVAGVSAFGPPAGPLDAEALERGIQTLREFSDAPRWDTGRDNCDDEEIEARRCIAEDGETVFDLLGYVGRGDKLVAARPVPMRLRPASNYYWRSNPYEVNGAGAGGTLLPGVDFRFAYWSLRWFRAP